MSVPTLGLLIVLIASLAACGGESVAAPRLRPRGESLFARHCSSCHSVSPDTVIVGPSLAGVGARAGKRVEGMDSRTYMETSIVDPDDYVVEGFRDVMPSGFGETLTPEDLEALIDYLTSLDG